MADHHEANDDAQDGAQDGAQAAPPRRRRRGEELHAALLDAAWQELVAVGYARLTMESVAARARTGIAVLYRRWANKDELTVAAIQHQIATHPVAMPDTGSLRDDMVALLADVGRARAAFAAVVNAAFSGLLADTGLTPAEVREKILPPESLLSGRIFARAQERGEIDLARVPPAVLAMPGDLMRHDLLMTLQPVSRARVLEIVDDLFMPLVTPGPAAAPAAGAGAGRAGGRKPDAAGRAGS